MLIDYRPHGRQTPPPYGQLVSGKHPTGILPTSLSHCIFYLNPVIKVEIRNFIIHAASFHNSDFANFCIFDTVHK